jgi:hypothetical protein
MADGVPYWWPKGSNKWGFNRRKPLTPQLIASAAQMAFIFGGPLVMLYMIPRWPPLAEDRVLVVIAVACMAFGFVASFVVIPRRTLPPRLPLAMNLMYRLGLGMCFAMLVFGVAGIANGYRTPVFVREVPVVAKWGPYVYARPWPGSRSVIAIDVSDSVYDGVEAPIAYIHEPEAELEAMPDAAQVRLVLGKGRLGFDWIKSAELPR